MDRRKEARLHLCHRIVESNVRFSANLEFDWVGSIGAGVEDHVLILAPWKFRAISHRVDLRKENHQRAITDVALDAFTVEDYFVANFMTKSALSTLAFYSDFNLRHLVRSSVHVSLLFEIRVFLFYALVSYFRYESI